MRSHGSQLNYYKPFCLSFPMCVCMIAALILRVTSPLRSSLCVFFYIHTTPSHSVRPSPSTPFGRKPRVLLSGVCCSYTYITSIWFIASNRTFRVTLRLVVHFFVREYRRWRKAATPSAGHRSGAGRLWRRGVARRR